MAATISYINPIQQQADVLSDNYIIEDNVWNEKIYEIQEEDYVHGGIHGYDNVPHEQLANRTLYLKNEIININNSINKFRESNNDQHNVFDENIFNIQNNITSIKTDILNFKETTNENIIAIVNNVDNLDDSLNATIKQLNEHTHDYAGSSVSGGAASKVQVNDYDHQMLYLTGTLNNDTIHNDTLFKTRAYIQEDTLYIQTIHSILADKVLNVNGNCLSADKLSKDVNIYFYGDVIGSCRTNFSPNTLNILTTLNAQQNLIASTYGPTEKQADVQLESDGTFTVPKLSINDKGIITSASNVTFSIPNEVVSGTTDAIEVEKDKLYLIGAKKQDKQQHTYTYNKVFIINNELYSNGFPVVNTTDKQHLINKTYNGYTLKEACEYEVDTSIQGEDKAYKKLITSHALYNHTHDYAIANNGNAVGVVINENTDDDVKYLTLNKDNKLYQNTNIVVKNNELTCANIYATESMHISGGKIWIDTSANAIDGSTVDTETYAKISNLQSQIDDLIQDLTSINQKYSNIYESLNTIKNNSQSISHDINCDELSFTVRLGQLIAYTDKYQLADNTNATTCNNIMLVTHINDNIATVINMGCYELENSDNNGKDCYVGMNGNILFNEPSNAYVKKIGYVEGNNLIFFPASYVTRN